jgi:hypothetical protein
MLKGSPLMKRMTCRTILLVLSMVACASAAGAQGVTLRYHWAKGDVLTYRLTTKTDTAISGVPGMGDMNVTQTMAQVLKLSVDDVAADGSTTVRETFQSVKMNMDSPMGQAAFDSAAADQSQSDPLAAALSKVMGAMVGESVTAVILPDGTVKSVEGASRILDKILKYAPDDQGAAAITQALKSTLTDDAMRHMMEQGLAMLPTQPVKVGDSWPTTWSTANEMMGKMTIASTFTLRSIDGPPEAQVAHIGIVMTSKQDVPPAPVGPMGMVMRISEGKGSGETTFDVAKGRSTSTTIHSETPATTSMTGPDGSSMTMSNLTKTTVTMELIDK